MLFHYVSNKSYVVLNMAKIATPNISHRKIQNYFVHTIAKNLIIISKKYIFPFRKIETEKKNREIQRIDIIKKKKKKKKENYPVINI